MIVVLLCSQLLHGLIGNGGVCPYLAMRMRIAGSHHGAAILEDLYVLDPLHRAEFGVLVGPDINYPAYIANLHCCESQIVAGREAHHAANPRFGSRDNQVSSVL